MGTYRFPAQRHRWPAAAVASAALAAISLGGTLASPAHASPARPASWLGEVSWTSQQLAPGITVRSGVLSDSAAKPYWTVTIDHTVTSSITGQPASAEVGPKAWATATAASLRADGYTPDVFAVDWPAYVGGPHGVEGYRVRTGDFTTQAAATTLATTLQGLGFSTAAVEWTGYDADQPPDGELIHEAVIDPRQVNLEITHNGILDQEQTTSSVATALGALVATNAGFFVTSTASGYVGAPAGLAVYNGKLESINSGPRASLIIDNGRPEIADVQANVAVHAGLASYPVNGINRIPGTDLQCGRPGDEPTSQPRQDITCTNASELVLFTDDLGAATPAGSGTQAVIGANGTVTSVGAQSATDVPAGGYVIQGIGAAGTWLAQHAVVGQRLAVSESLATTSGQRIPLTPGLDIASAAPIVVSHGTSAIDAISEGDVDPSDLSFNFAWAQGRQPRTIAGINAKGDLLLVTVDGRQPGAAEGVTLSEEAELLTSLGAVSAMNLDGGGSTDFTVNGTEINQPAYGYERLVGDFVLALPKK